MRTLHPNVPERAWPPGFSLTKQTGKRKAPPGGDAVKGSDKAHGEGAEARRSPRPVYEQEEEEPIEISQARQTESEDGEDVDDTSVIVI